MIKLLDILNESYNPNIYQVECTVAITAGNRPIPEVLSDIRAVPGVTVVDTIDSDYNTEEGRHLIKLSIKIDPSPFNPFDSSSYDKILSDIKKLPDIRGAKFTSNPIITEGKLHKLIKEVLQEKADRCKRIADRKYDKPSAYKSGAIVRCRKGKIWKKLKETTLSSLTNIKSYNDLDDEYAQDLDAYLQDDNIDWKKESHIDLLDPNQIEPSEWNYLSDDPNNSKSIKYSKLDPKLFPPILVVKKGSKYEVIDGIHRVYAFRLNNHKIPAIVISPKLEQGLNTTDEKMVNFMFNKYKDSNIPTPIKINNLKEDETLNEYSAKIVSQLVDKFKQEQPDLNTNTIQAYIDRFTQIKNSPKVSEKDITKYSWKELETAVDSNQPKRIKAGKINDGEPSKDANLVYNQNGLRIYVGKTKQACIKYGNGYSFCISARGEDSMYPAYRYSQGGTPYFIFDDTKSSEQDKDGNFIDPEHLLVIFKYKSPEEGSEYGDGYSVTNANNPGEDEFSDFSEVEKYYPRLKGLKNIFQSVAADPKEKAEYEIGKKYNKELSSIESKYNGQDENFTENNYIFNNIKSANSKIDNFINNKVQLYKFTATLKPTADEDEYDSTEVSQYRYGDPEKSYKDFVEEIVIFMYDGPGDPKDSIKDWDIIYKKQEISDENYRSYLEEVKQLVDKYRNELTKLRILKEQIDLLTEKQKETLRTWFKRKGAPGKEGGWVDCNTCRKVDGKTKCKSCGRKKGEKRAKYPSCRPTATQCKQPGKGKKWGKTK